MTTKVLISKQPHKSVNIKIQDMVWEDLGIYNYLGIQVKKDWSNITEIKARTEHTRTAFRKMNKILHRWYLKLPLQKSFVSYYVIPILLYGAEAWAVNQNEVNKLKNFEIWSY